MSETRLARVLEKNVWVSGCRFTRSAMFIDVMDEATLVSAGALLQTVEGSRAWWWGDFINAWCKWRLAQDEKDGEREPDPKVREQRAVRYAAQYARIAHVEVGTVIQWKAVAAFFEPLSRLNDLSWAHHQEAYMGSGGDLAVAQNWLDEALRNGWSKAQLRGAIRAKKQREAQGGGEDEPMREVMFPEWDNAARWASAAITRVDDMDEDELKTIIADADALMRLIKAAGQALQRKAAA